MRKDLNWWDLTVFGVSVVIGAGIFTITASTAGNITGPAISISFVIAAIACGLAALCYAEFASTVPVAGSAYTFSYATFGEFIAWIIGWDLILEFAVAAAVVAKGWSGYLGTVFGFGGGTADLGGISLDWGALLIIAFVTVLLAWGTKLSAEVSLAITVIKVAVVLLVVIVGAFYIKPQNYSPFIPPPSAGEGGTGAEQSLFSLLTGAEGSHYGWYGMLAGASIGYAQSQLDDARRRLSQEAAGRVFSGADIGFRSKGVDRGTPVLVPVVKVNGEWVEVQLGMPGIQRLTQ